MSEKLGSKKIIAVDIDDVLSRSSEVIIQFGNERFNINLSQEDLTEDLSEMWQISREEAEETWVEYLANGAMERYDVVPEARDALHKLRADYTLIAVTSRRKVLMDISQKWLDANYPGCIDKLVCAQIYGEGKQDAHLLTKAEVLQELGAEFLIDDQPKHCIGAASVGVKAVLFGGYPWNRDVDIPKSVVRCNNWPSVVEYFDGQRG